MKCKKCGHRCNTIQAMARHYRKAHPKAMKSRTGQLRSRKGRYRGGISKYGTLTENQREAIARILRL